MTSPRRPHGRRTLSWWRYTLLATALAVAAILASGCSTANQVPWETYDPALQQQIDSAAAEKDCATLAALHVKAHLTDKQHTKATGFSNAALIDYIQTAQRYAGCTTA
jgi:hypothetical protein